MKRQQAAEDAIALSMAKVTTGEKLERLPQGQIFGMRITEPESQNSKKSFENEVSVSSTNQTEVKYYSFSHFNL